MNNDIVCQSKWLTGFIALACILSLVTMKISAAPLDPDMNFDGDGRVTYHTGQQQAQIGRSAAQADGKLIVTGTHFVQIGGLTGTELSVRRFNENGSPDTDFGVHGESRFSVRGNDAVNMVALQPDGKILLALSAQEPCTNVMSFPPACISGSGQPSVQVSAIARLNTDGTLDTTLDGKGFVEAGDFYGGYAIAVQPDGKMLLLGTTSIARARIFNWKLARFNTDGTRDASFNAGQTVSSRCDALGYALLLQQDGSIIVSGDQGVFYADSLANPGICMERLHPDGSHDLAFNLGQLFTHFGLNIELRSLAAQPDGKILAIGRGISTTQSPHQSGVIAARYSVNGVLDTSYGHDGTLFLPLAEQYTYVGSALTRNNGIIAGGLEYPHEDQKLYRTTLLKLSPDGLADPAFGINGIAHSNLTTDILKDFLIDKKNRWIMVSQSVLPDLNTVGLIERYRGENMDGLPVAEFYHAHLDHYFITADAAEATAIENGSAGPGWIRTGNSFKSGGSSPVCRFYGSMNPGPNAHFYTLAGPECELLKQLQANTPDTDKRWNFESLDFDSTLPTTSGIGGICPTGTTPVYRAYNNGFARGIDSNHRITSSQEAILEVTSRGWINEGVVMCAPD